MRRTAERHFPVPGYPLPVPGTRIPVTGTRYPVPVYNCIDARSIRVAVQMIQLYRVNKVPGTGYTVPVYNCFDAGSNRVQMIVLSVADSVPVQAYALFTTVLLLCILLLL